MDFKAIYKHVKFLNFWCFLSLFLYKNSKMSLRPVFSDRGSYIGIGTGVRPLFVPLVSIMAEYTN